MSKFYLPKELDCHHTIFTTNVLPSQVTQSDLINISRNKNHYFLQFNFRNSVSLPHQGFKIHVSCTLHSYQRVLDSVFTLCKSNEVTFKYISNKDMIIKNLSGHGSLWSSGKFITIYPQNNVEFRNIIEKLYLIEELTNEQGIFVLTDRRYKDSKVIFYRYGVIKGEDKNIYDNEGNVLYRDHDSLEYRLPNFIEEPFPLNSDTNKKEEYLFKKYIPKRGLNSKASGSVFEACTINGKYITLKNAKYGYEDFANTEIEKLKNEKKWLNKLS